MVGDAADEACDGCVTCDVIASAEPWVGPLPTLRPADARDAAALPALSSAAGRHGPYPAAVEYGLPRAMGEAAPGAPIPRWEASGARYPPVPSNAVLGGIAPPSLRTDLVAGLARDEGDDLLARRLNALRDLRGFEREFIDPAATVTPGRRHTDLPQGLIQGLRDARVLRPVAAPQGALEARLRAVPKRGADAETWRAILACLLTNEASRPPDRTPLPHMRELIYKVLQQPYAATADLKSWFYEFGIALPIARRYFIVRWQDGTYAFVRMPMGWTWAPYLGCNAAMLIWRAGIRRAGGRAVYTTVWIDDSIIAGVKADVRACRSAVQAECDRVGAVIKSWTEGPSFTYVGLDFDLDVGTARLNVSFTRAFGAAAEQAGAAAATLHDAWSAVGGAVWACYTLGLPYAPLASAMADIAAAVARGDGPGAPMALTAGDAGRLAALAAYVASPAAVVRGRAVPLRPIAVASDASDMGIGVVDDHGELALPFVHRVSHKRVQRGEMIGVLAAVRRLVRTGVRRRRIVLFTDNSGAAWRMARWAAPPQLADVVKELWCLCATYELELEVRWLSTHVMPADRPSRERVAGLTLTASPDWAELHGVSWAPPGAAAVQPRPIPGWCDP